MRFSIVIPVYNVEKYLSFCVESVLIQVFRDFELILVDDGSPDNCGTMCDGFAEKDSRIKVIHQKNGGLSSARNTGIAAASGEYVLFLDSDDWWADQNVLKEIEINLQKTNADVLSFNYQKAYHAELSDPYFAQNISSLYEAVGLKEIVNHKCWVTGACNKVIRRSFLIDNNLYFRIGITSEDIDWTLRLALCAEKYAYINLCVFIYRQTASSISNSTSASKVECLCDNIRECIRLLDAAAPEKSEILKPFVAYQYGTLLHNAANIPNFQRSKKLIEGIRDMKWLLQYADNMKVRCLQMSTRAIGFSGTFLLLRIRQKILNRLGKGV